MWLWDIYCEVDYFAISSSHEIFCEKITALVVSLAKLHNFCIDETDVDISQPLNCDEENLLVHGSGTVPLQTSIEHGN